MHSSIRNPFRALRARFARHRAVVLATHELEASSDRVLAELGIARGDIAEVAHGRYRRS